jgi:HME family heavy-metal exporter
VVFRASVEIRNSIVFGTMIVVLVFLPLFALSGMEGRLFTPLGIAYIVSIVSSLLVSLTVTPVLSYLLLERKYIWPAVVGVLGPALAIGATWFLWPEISIPLRVLVSVVGTLAFWAAVWRSDRTLESEPDGWLLRGLKRLAGAAIRLSLRAPVVILTAVAAVVIASAVALAYLERDFLPPFNEGAVQINVLLPPGTSLETSNEAGRRVERRLQEIDDITAFVRKTGRAELDEHAEGVNVSEVIASLDPESQRSREEILTDIRETLDDIPGIVTSVEQPLAHLISHMLSGVKAQVGIKLYGDDLDLLRREAQRIVRAINGADGREPVEGVEDLQIEQQVAIRQLRIEVDGYKLRDYGLRRDDINEFIETAMNGQVISDVLLGQRTFDLLVRLDEPFRENLDAVKRLAIHLPGGGTTTLDSVANIYEAQGPNTINREQARRRIVIQCNTSGRGLVDVVEDIKGRLRPIEQSLPTGYFLEYGGQFESQQAATRVIGVLFVVSLVGMLLVLYTMFGSVNLSLQVMIALPAAFIGAVAALYLTGQTLTVAAMVGFISLCGIASRNGILLINHYLHLVKNEGESWSHAMIVRAGQERLAPVLMTALTSGIGLVPLAMATGEPGKEILYPVATVIIGGLITSTLLEFFVRPAVFWVFGVGWGAAQAAVAGDVAADALDDAWSDSTPAVPGEPAG